MSKGDNTAKVEYGNRRSRAYTKIAESDPSKVYVQRPMALRLLGDCEGKSVIDIGCGGGILTRQIRAARAVGYDVSPSQIGVALREEKKNPNGIDYLVADPSTIKAVLGERGLPQQFDKALSVLVLTALESREQFAAMFRSTADILREGGVFVSITVSPFFKRFGKTAYNRVWGKPSGEKGTIGVLDNNGNLKFSVACLHVSQLDYENAARAGGFTETHWTELKIEPEGVRILGKRFWKGYVEDCPYIAFIARK
jgi:SAM-dependent methyltransferase